MEELIKRLKEVMSIQTTSYGTAPMNEFIYSEVANIPNCTIEMNNGNIYVTKGESDLYPCIVSHTDTVHDIHKEFHVVEVDGCMIAVNQNMERVGVGGDDKVGIFVALEMLRLNNVCKAAFFRDEEVGCVGSKVADMTFFKDVTLALQCDRQGYNDFVNKIFNLKLYSKDFSEAISDILKEYDREETSGGMTDVWQLAENGLGVACANMSCGYYDPHSDNEFIDIHEVIQTLSLVNDIVEAVGHTKWEIENRFESNPYGGYGHSSWSRSWRDDYALEETEFEYRRYGKGWERTTNPSSVTTDKGDLMHDKKVTCSCCEHPATLWWDEWEESFYCLQCDSYKSIDDVTPVDDIEGIADYTNSDDSLLDHIESVREKYEKIKDDDVPF